MALQGVEVSNAMKVGFPRMRLAGETRQGRNDTLHVQKRCARPLEPLRQLRTALPMGIRRAGPCVRRAGFEPAALCRKLFRLERCAEFPFVPVPVRARCGAVGLEPTTQGSRVRSTSCRRGSALTGSGRLCRSERHRSPLTLAGVVGVAARSCPTMCALEAWRPTPASVATSIPAGAAGERARRRLAHTGWTGVARPG